MMQMYRRTAVLSTLLLGLVACGSGNQTAPSAQVLLGTVQQRVSAIIPGGGTALAIQPQLTRAMFADVPGEILYVTIPSRGAFATVAKVAVNQGTSTWQAADNITLSTRDGVLVATRGLGVDLMSADNSGLRQALAQGGGNYSKVLYSLDGEDQTVPVSLNCTLTAQSSETVVVVERAYETTRLGESCTGSEATFGNTYWRGHDGTLWASEQWVSGAIGMMRIEKIQ